MTEPRWVHYRDCPICRRATVHLLLSERAGKTMPALITCLTCHGLFTYELKLSDLEQEAAHRLRTFP